ncbi:hypothetical protein HN960_05420 [Candidatus Peregrinibacteria bacterium]|jgi:hypothetical protein|nr:hypothetical protein [Candidatus Peregrinibacteria bacterium]MBT7009842.1 hypothetical protein [Candidatus Peregrinibacteria bacterium]
MAVLIVVEEGSTPTTPASTKWKLYPKSDGIYALDDAGVETGPFGVGGSAGGSEGLMFWDEGIPQATGTILNVVGANATLSVSGTVANLTVTGSASLPTAKVKKTSNQSTSNTTVTTLTWDAEDWDTDTFHDNVTNNSRLTAPEDGKYLVIANIIFASNNTGIRQILINLNGANVWGVIFPNNGAGQDQTFTFFPIEMSTSDYVECQVYQASGGNLDIGSTQSRFSIVKLAN